jgi:hypothetical protein
MATKSGPVHTNLKSKIFRQKQTDAYGSLGNIPEQQNVRFLHTDFSILILDKYLMLLVTNTYKNNEPPPKRANKTAVLEPTDQNSINMHKKPRDLMLQRNGEVKYRLP